jgi:hypothetical protein
MKPSGKPQSICGVASRAPQQRSTRVVSLLQLRIAEDWLTIRRIPGNDGIAATLAHRAISES